MSKLVPPTLATALLLVLLTFGSSVYLVAADATVSIVDLRTLNEAQEPHFPGSAAFDYHPQLRVVGRGQDILFVNKGLEPHTVTSYTIKVEIILGDVTVHMPIPDGRFDSGFDLIESGETFTLNTGSLEAGDYAYFCQIHPWMQAVLRVGSDKVNTPVVNVDHKLGEGTIERLNQIFAAGAAWTFLPTGLTVKKGTVVTFTNNGLLPHTVTSYTDKVSVPFGDLTILFPVEDGRFDSDFLAPGASFTLNTRLLQRDTYTYFCEFHPWMQATLTVG